MASTMYFYDNIAIDYWGDLLGLDNLLNLVRTCCVVNLMAEKLKYVSCSHIKKKKIKHTVFFSFVISKLEHLQKKFYVTVF